MRKSSLFDLLDENEEAGVDFENAILDGASLYLIHGSIKLSASTLPEPV